MNATFLYTLLDPETEEIRYVGKADDPWDRLKRGQQARRAKEAAALIPVGVLGMRMLIAIIVRFRDTERARGREKYYREKERKLCLKG